MRADCRQSIYFPAHLLAELKAEAARQDRSISNVLQLAWKAARERIKQMAVPTIRRAA